jgi:hypothetical protein
MHIQERSCPVCAIRRTLCLWAGRSLCANCKTQWSAGQTSTGVSRRPHETGSTSRAFSAAELRRLAVYRAAMARAFFTDDLPSASFARRATG